MANTLTRYVQVQKPQGIRHGLRVAAKPKEVRSSPGERAGYIGLLTLEVGPEWPTWRKWVMPCRAGQARNSLDIKNIWIFKEEMESSYNAKMQQSKNSLSW
ncbi:hypothetical protein SAY86_020181 [Trapa natans]|uniref:Uncharacterized protein n=1 Tax=Trapa natans TaxID=22666 RepID=A0AAN7LMG2_TRANT|nr:hypothetical protein SAY86_020181 [Trapa natans]